MSASASNVVDVLRERRPLTRRRSLIGSIHVSRSDLKPEAGAEPLEAGRALLGRERVSACQCDWAVAFGGTKPQSSQRTFSPSVATCLLVNLLGQSITPPC